HEVLTHVSVGPFIGYRFGGDAPGAFAFGVEVSALHAFQGCSAYDPTPVVGLTAGIQYVPSEERTLIWTEAEGAYALAFFTSGLALGPALEIHDGAVHWGVQSTQFAGMLGQL